MELPRNKNAGWDGEEYEEENKLVAEYIHIHVKDIPDDTIKEYKLK